MNNAADPLADLKDIYIPPDPGFWPPAPGWWVLVVIGILLLFWVVKWINNRIKHNQPKKYFIKQLAAIETACAPDKKIPALHQMSKLLRRFAIHKFGREKIASLHGDEWLKFLDATSDDHQFSAGVGAVFAKNQYDRETPVDLEALRRHLLDWCKSVR